MCIFLVEHDLALQVVDQLRTHVGLDQLLIRTSELTWVLWVGKSSW